MNNSFYIERIIYHGELLLLLNILIIFLLTKPILQFFGVRFSVTLSLALSTYLPYYSSAISRDFEYIHRNSDSIIKIRESWIFYWTNGYWDYTFTAVNMYAVFISTLITFIVFLYFFKQSIKQTIFVDRFIEITKYCALTNFFFFLGYTAGGGFEYILATIGLMYNFYYFVRYLIIHFFT